jgi:hypothetical protein
MADIDRIATLEAETVGTVTIPVSNVDEIEVFSDGAAEVFYRLGYGAGLADPEVGALPDGVFYLPAVPSARTHRVAGGRSQPVVKLISGGTPRVCVQVLR